MSYSAYPTEADLLRFLQIPMSGDVPDTVRTFLAAQVGAARADLEQECNRVFLAPATAVTRYYDPPTDRARVLFIDDFATVTGIVYQPVGSSAETLTASTDYVLEPRNGPSESRPYTQVRFLNRSWMLPLSSTLYGSIAITGRRGYATSLPDNIWLAILARAAGNLWQAHRAGVTQGILGFTEGDLKIDFGVEPGKAMTEGWQAQYAAVVAQYQRLSL